MHSKNLKFMLKQNYTNTRWYLGDESRAMDSDHFVGLDLRIRSVIVGTIKLFAELFFINCKIAIFNSGDRVVQNNKVQRIFVPSG